jgi:RNA polymerase sigma-70 factor (ECF subfamily)
MTTPATAFLDELRARRPTAGSEAIAVSPAVRDAIDATLASAHAAAAEAWSPVALEIQRYARHLAICAAASPEGDDLLGALGSLHLTDLYLACAAGHGAPDAAELFVRSFLQPIAGAVHAIDSSPALLEDVRQAMHERLLLGLEGPPRILQYGGRASLASWIGVAARRTALGLLRENEAHQRALERAADEPLAVELDPELAFLKTRYRGAFKAAVSAALGRLPQRERTVIRLHTVGGLTLARIATMLAVDESTVCRWEKRARATILAETQRELGAQLGVEVTELPSLARLVTSQLDVSVARLLSRESVTPGPSRAS